MVSKCLHYNYNNSTDTCTDSFQKCAREVNCPFDEGYHCFVVYTPNETTPISAGCNPPYSSTNDKCGNECIGQYKGKRYLYCCCAVNLCNRNLTLPPTPPPTPSTTPSYPTNLTASGSGINQKYAYANNISVLAQIWYVVPIVLIISIAALYIYRFRKRFLTEQQQHEQEHERQQNGNEYSNDRRNNDSVQLNELNRTNNFGSSILAPFRNALSTGSCRNRADGDQNDDSQHERKFLNVKSNIKSSKDHHQKTSINNHDEDDRKNELIKDDNRIDLNSVELLEIIGNGRFGTVHRARFADNKSLLNKNTEVKEDNSVDETSRINEVDNENDIVAVKIIMSSDYQSWLNEQQVFKSSRVKHPNILKYIYSDEYLETGTYWLIVEYASRGSLHSFLKENTMNWKEFLQISLGVVHGLSHLHEADVAHRDFKSKNVLLKADMTPCITDFGVAAILDTANGSSKLDYRKKYLQVGTPRYMAPEVLECSVTFTKASFTKIDVYALSLVLWELISRCHSLLPNGQVPEYKLPFEDIAGSGPDISLMRQIVVVDKTRPALRDEWRNYPASEVCRAIEDGWEYDHDARISASCFVERVESLPEVI